VPVLTQYDDDKQRATAPVPRRESRQTVTRLAREYDVDIRTAAPRPRVIIDRNWLHEQYAVRRRTLPDLARETGMSTANLTRWAKTHGLPLRPRGARSHQISLRARAQATTAPMILRLAVDSPGGWARLQRFVAASSYPTLRVAAVRLGTSQGALTSQIDRLERDLGSKILVRAEPGRPMALTSFGGKIVRAVRVAAGGP
jgi:DNA-binding transcriptional LysR family regulator